jgi:hypothetical protein
MEIEVVNDDAEEKALPPKGPTQSSSSSSSSSEQDIKPFELLSRIENKKGLYASDVFLVRVDGQPDEAATMAATNPVLAYPELKEDNPALTAGQRTRILAAQSAVTLFAAFEYMRAAENRYVHSHGEEGPAVYSNSQAGIKAIPMQEALVEVMNVHRERAVELAKKAKKNAKKEKQAADSAKRMMASRKRKK